MRGSDRRQSAIPHDLDSVDQENKFLNGSLPDELWSQVMDRSIPAPFSQSEGQHSCNTVVIDRAGNIATGTHTINALPWGEFGLFVDGVSLNSAHAVALKAPPGTRAIDGLNPVLVFQNGKPVIAAGFFAQALQPAALQIVSNLLDYDLSPGGALGLPRFGFTERLKPLRILLDARYPKAWIEDFSKKGIGFSQPSGFIDTGMGMVIRIDPKTGIRSGSPSELIPGAVALAE